MIGQIFEHNSTRPTLHQVAGSLCAIGSFSLSQVQYQTIFEAVVVFLDTFESYANYQE